MAECLVYLPSATLAPSKLLAKNTKYKATITACVEDLAGNRLDQTTKEGNPGKSWTFTTRK